MKMRRLKLDDVSFFIDFQEEFNNLSEVCYGYYKRVKFLVTAF